MAQTVDCCRCHGVSSRTKTLIPPAVCSIGSIPSRNYLWPKRAASLKVNLSLQAAHIHCFNSRQLWSLDELQSSLWNQWRFSSDCITAHLFPLPTHPSFSPSQVRFLRVRLNKTYCKHSLPQNLFREANQRSICCQIPLRNSLTPVPEYKHL